MLVRTDARPSPIQRPVYHHAGLIEHQTKWSGCTACELCRHRRQVVLYRGECPCDVLIIGEAPGDTEDGDGLPFVGPAGRHLDRMLSDALAESWAGQPVDRECLWCGFPNMSPHCGRCRGDQVRFGFTNIVACIPYKLADDGAKSGELRDPSKVEAKACAGRLKEIIGLTQPRLIVTAGRVAKTYLQPLGKFLTTLQPVPAVVAIVHPSYLLRLKPSDPQLRYQGRKAVLALVAEFEKLL